MKWLLFCLLVVGMEAHAQQTALYFDKLTTEQGLSHNKVNCILQDQQGFIWVGTDDGLNRFDGRRFVHFRHRPHDSTSLSGNIITDLVEDAGGRLWVATADGGLSRYDRRLPPARQFKQYRHHPQKPGSLPATTVNCLLLDPKGHLWLGTSGKNVLRFTPETEQFQAIAPSAKTVLDMAMDAQGQIWVGRQGGGLMILNPETLNTWEDPRYKNLYARLPHVTVTSLFATGQQLWFGAWDKHLYRSTTANRQEMSYGPAQGFVPDELLCFARDKQGRLWMGGREHGLQILNGQRFEHHQHQPAREGSLAANRINCLFQDREGRMWLGTNRGLSIHQPSRQQFVQQFLPAQGQQPLTIFAFHEDDVGNIFMGSSKGIFVRQANGKLIHKPLFFRGNALQVTSFLVDEGQWYLGTNHSVFRYDPLRHTIALLPNTEQDSVMKQLINSRVVSMKMHEVEGRKVLLALPYGHYLAYYDFVRSKWISRLDSLNIIARMNLQDNLMRKLHRSPDGQLWMATAKAGLGQFSNTGFPRLSYYQNNPDQASSLANNDVFDLADDGRGGLWLSTQGSGLLHGWPQKGQFTPIAGSGNLAEGLCVDGRGRVWLISNGHLQAYDPGRKEWQSFQLPDVEKTGGLRGQIFKASDGQLFVAGTNYFVAFHPDSIRVVRSEPRVVFTDFQIFNQSFSHHLAQPNIALRAKENYFTIEFSAPEFSLGQPIRYRYQLAGFNDQWVEAGERNQVSYSNLPGGHYKFRVQASNRAGAWAGQEASLSITVVPPFWRTAWFFALCAAAALALAYALYRYRINELLKRQAIRNRIAQDLHDSVGSTLSSISVYSQVAKIYQQKQQDQELKNALEKISTTSTEMISELNDTVWAIDPRHDQMEVILQRMESFARPLLATQQIQFHFRYDASVPQLNLEMEKRKGFYVIFKEAVNNAVKYADCLNLQVDIQLKRGQLFMRIADDGKGFDLSTTSEGYKSSDSFGGGNGLRNMQQRATAMKGKLTVGSQPGQGTSLQLQFPIP